VEGLADKVVLVTAVVAFVASDEASFVSGDSWLVDGGYCA
jgi:hypothetical protein